LILPVSSVQPVEHSAASSVPEERVVALASGNYTYHDYAQVESALLDLESRNPGIAEVQDIGDSWEKAQGLADRDVLAIKVSDNVVEDEDEPEVLITALHHAREWISTEIAVALAENLTDNYGSDPRVSWLVDNREVWIVPVVNPDGLDYSLANDSMWRKNRRLNADLTYGVDLNRNYDGSSNGDPLGEWGGAGSSSTPSSDVYRGESPFSEPETQAVRDLVLSRNFTLALDIHSYGNQVLWPWGYTTNQTPNHVDFQRIGSELAEVNGYVSEQSVTLYPTTGDSIDWMYGFAGIYAFCFEVGDEFHPLDPSVVRASIEVNLNASILAMELAGDREDRGFSIVHSPITVANYTPAGYDVSANITADRGINDSAVSLHYILEGYDWTEVPMTKSTGNNTYSAHIPSAPAWHSIGYYISARDMGGVFAVTPTYAPYARFEFLVTPPSSEIGEISFSIPDVVDGSDAWQVNATVINCTQVLNLTLGLRQTTGLPPGWPPLPVAYPMLRINATHYRARFDPGMITGNYSAVLLASVGSLYAWNSSEVSFEIQDRTPPLVTEVTSTLVQNSTDPGRHVEVRVSGYDVYGIVEIRLMYRLAAGPWTTMSHLAIQKETSLSHLFEITVGERGGVLEFRAEVLDSVSSGQFPSDSSPLSLRFGSADSHIQLVTIGAGVAAVALACAAAYLLIRVRRRQASGP